MFRIALAGLALLGASLGPVAAQAPAPAAAQDRRAETRRFFPPDSVTQHEIALSGRKLAFTATAGSIPLMDASGAVQAEIGYVSYALAGAEPGTRPVTFAVNGGPGAASAYLHLGVLGPWRLPLDGASISPSQPIAVTPNADTWLDFTDLVFLDPVGTGFSLGAGSSEDVRGRYWTVDGDIASLSDAIGRWLKSKDRLSSPKFIVGESYGASARR